MGRKKKGADLIPAYSKRKEFAQHRLRLFFLEVGRFRQELHSNNLGSWKQSWCFSPGFKRLETAQ